QRRAHIRYVCLFFPAYRAPRNSPSFPSRRSSDLGIEVKITFKNPKDAKEGALRTATEADGMYYAYLDFTGYMPSASVAVRSAPRSEEHTSELQSLAYLVCRLPLEKKKKTTETTTT